MSSALAGCRIAPSLSKNDKSLTKRDSCYEKIYSVSKYPTIIQGGMGAGVSSWRLARAVSQLGQLGVVSGTALDQILARRLQDGDPGGHMRRGLDHFPFRRMAERIWETYYIPDGKPERQSYKTLPKHSKDNSRRAYRAMYCCELCRSVSRSRRPRQSGRHQLPGENSDSASSVSLRRHARRCRLRSDGRGRPFEDSWRARSFCQSRTRNLYRCTSQARRRVMTRR